MKLERPHLIWHGKYQRILTLDIHPFINLLVTGGSDDEVYEGEDLELEEEIGFIKLWCINENYKPGGNPEIEPPVTFIRALKKHSNPVNCLRFSPNGQYMASGSDDHKIVIWKIERSFQNICSSQKIFNLVAVHILEGHNKEVCDLRWFSDNIHLISGGMDQRAYIWDTKQGVIKQTIIGGHKSYIQGVAVDPKMKYCVTLGNDRQAKVWRKLKATNKKKNIFEYIPSNTIKRLPFQDTNELIPSEEEEENQSNGNQVEAQNNQYLSYGLFLSERQLNSFFKRPDWSPDGSFFLIPAAFYQEKRDSKIEMCVYLYRRNVLNKPSLILSTNNKPAICIRFCQKIFQKKEGAFSIVDIPYTIVFAISTIDSVIVYSTESLTPLAVAGNIHYAIINDMVFFQNQSLIICSSDGLCSFIFFEEGELGEPLNSLEVDQELQQILFQESFYPIDLLKSVVYPKKTQEFIRNIINNQKSLVQSKDIKSLEKNNQEEDAEYVVEKFNMDILNDEVQINTKPQEIKYKVNEAGEQKKVIVPKIIKKY